MLLMVVSKYVSLMTYRLSQTPKDQLQLIASERNSLRQLRIWLATWMAGNPFQSSQYRWEVLKFTEKGSRLDGMC